MTFISLLNLNDEGTVDVPMTVSDCFLLGLIPIFGYCSNRASESDVDDADPEVGPENSLDR